MRLRMFREQEKSGRRPGLFVGMVLTFVAFGSFSPVFATDQDQTLRVGARFNEREAVAPDATLELRLSRPFLSGDGRFAVFIGQMDVTAFCSRDDQALTYTPRPVRLPLGQTSVIVYLVSGTNHWTEIARFPLLVEEPRNVAQVTNTGRNGESAAVANNSPVAQDSSTNTATTNERSSPFKFIPSVSVNVKSQSTVLFFPDTNRPQRINFTDVALQTTLQGNYQRGPTSLQNQFELAGSTVQAEALRFGELRNDAPQIDLSSYLLHYQFNRAQLRLGQVSFGANRQLINSFSSRGISLTVPVTKRFDVGGAIVNGTSIVGFGNFFGLNRTQHQVLSGTLGVELLEERPGGLRLEFTTMRGSLLPLNNFNESNVNDAERSHGGGIRVIGSDKSGRLRFDGGFARSRFTNPSDPLLDQGLDVVPVRATSRNAHYLDISLEALRDYKITEKRPVTLTLSFKHERVDPLFRSVAAYSTADRLNNQFDLTGTFGAIAFGFGHTRGNDNLEGIRSILRTLTRRTAFNIAAPATSLFSNDDTPSQWVPRLTYSFDRVHQIAAFIPENGDFTSPSNIPDQASINHSFAAEWQFTSILRIGYRFNHSFQDNRQLTRERNDLLTVINGVTVGLNPTTSLDLNFDLGTERSSAFDQNTINKTLRVGTNLTWRMTGTSVWAINASTTGAGDLANTNNRRDVDFDIQYSWRFLQTEKSRWKKVQGQFFIRYANRYGSAFDNVFGFNTFTKLQTFNAGLNFIFF